MAKFLLAVLLIVIALKLIVDDALVYQYTIVQIEAENDCKNETDDDCSSKKTDDGKEKHKKFYDHKLSYSFIKVKDIRSFTSSSDMPVPGFVDTPYLPPNLF